MIIIFYVTIKLLFYRESQIVRTCSSIKDRVKVNWSISAKDKRESKYKM